MPSLIQFYELPLIGTILTSIFKVIIFLPNILILWRKFRAEGEIFYGIDGTNGIDEGDGINGIDRTDGRNGINGIDEKFPSSEALLFILSRGRKGIKGY